MSLPFSFSVFYNSTFGYFILSIIRHKISCLTQDLKLGTIRLRCVIASTASAHSLAYCLLKVEKGSSSLAEFLFMTAISPLLTRTIKALKVHLTQFFSLAKVKL